MHDAQSLNAAGLQVLAELKMAAPGYLETESLERHSLLTSPNHEHDEGRAAAESKGWLRGADPQSPLLGVGLCLSPHGASVSKR